MKLSHCKLKRKVQRKLLEYFVLEVTARSAADLLAIHPNSAALFYKKVRLVISYHLEQEALKVFEGEVELDESYTRLREHKLWWCAQRKKRSRCWR